MNDIGKQIEETRQIFKELGEDVQNEIKAGIIAASMLVKDTAKRKFQGPSSRSEGYDPMDPRPHVDTGLLRNSIDYTLNNNGDGAKIGTSVEYAAKYEYGESIAVPHPFLNNSFEECKPKIFDRFEKGFNQALDKKR